MSLAADLVARLRALRARVTGRSTDAEMPVQLYIAQGNPGPKYAGNRHNLGFRVIDRIAREHGFSPWRSKFSGQVAEGWIETQTGRVKVLLLRPETYYNETGRALADAIRFYKLDAGDATVFHDEIDLAPGRVRVKRGGGHSGNNGLRSIIAQVGADVRRVRLGVGHPGDKAKVMPYLLTDFSKADMSWVDPLVEACAHALPHLANGEDERFQGEVMRRAPAPKRDPRRESD